MGRAEKEGGRSAPLSRFSENPEMVPICNVLHVHIWASEKTPSMCQYIFSHSQIIAQVKLNT